MVGGGVFINYRVADSQGYAALLYSELSGRFGSGLVFMDNESIPAGSDFVIHLIQWVRQARIVLVVIGPGWLTAADPSGRRRIDDPDDWIRRELVEAVSAGATIIPVLTDGTSVPLENQLPQDIAWLARCQYRRLRHRSVSADLARLVADLTAIDPRLAARATGTPLTRSHPIIVGRPPLRADAFQERPALRDELAVPGAAATYVIAGDGGTGKTQLAAAAFIAALPGVDVAIWITAATRASVLSAYAETYAAIHASPAPAGDAEQQAAHLLGWLAGGDRRWLVVLDDVVDPVDLRGLWPSGPGGRVLVTTRRRDAALLARGPVVDVGTFTRAESMAYLTAKLGGVAGVPATVLDQAARLAEDLGDLPLALSHAAATIINDGITCAGYRALLVDGAHRLSDLLPTDPIEAGDDYPHPVVSTWSLARDRADRLAPAGLAGPMLDVIAFLDPNGVPESVLTSAPVRDHLAGAGIVSPAQARRAVRNLRRLSLVSHDPDDVVRSVRMHALAQRAGIERLESTAAARTIRALADGLIEVWPAIEAGTALGQALRANATVLIGRRPVALWEAVPHPILFRLGASLSESGLAADARTYFGHLAARSRDLLGAEHPGTLRARHCLARARGEAGDLAGATAACRDLLVDRIRVSGPDHPDTFATRGSLGWWSGMARDFDGAVAAFQALLADQLRVLGSDHPDTLSTRNSLARWLGEAGDLDGAITTFDELLVDELRLLGPDHPDTLTTRNNLAHVRGKAGDPAGAAAEVEQVLAARLRLLGPEHPRTLTTRAHLARWQGEAGNPSAAAEAFTAVLADELRLLGPEHPRTLTTRAHLARWRGESGDPSAAANEFKAVLVDRIRILGRAHPDTIVAEQEFSYWQQRSVSGPSGSLPPMNGSAGHVEVRSP